MEALKFVLIGLSVLFLAHQLWAFANVVWASNWVLQAESLEFHGKEETKIVILIPMYQEAVVAQSRV